MSFDDTIRQIIREEIERAAGVIGKRISELECQLGQSSDCYLTIPKAAEIAGYETTDTIHQWIKDGLLKTYGHGRPRVKRSELFALMERKPIKAVSLEDEVENAARRLIR